MHDLPKNAQGRQKGNKGTASTKQLESSAETELTKQQIKMNAELEQKLIEKYPDMFSGVNDPITENLMGFGCEHGDGWYDLLDTMCRFMSKAIEQRGFVELKEPDEEGHSYAPYAAPKLKFVQIKEKFGTLCVYYDMYKVEDPQHDKFVEASVDECHARLSGMISAYEAYTEYLSGKTCEVCGDPGKLYTDGWWSTRCPKHSRNQENEQSN